MTVFILYPNRTQRQFKNPYKAHNYWLCRDLPFVYAKIFLSDLQKIFFSLIPLYPSSFLSTLTLFPNSIITTILNPYSIPIPPKNLFLSFPSPHTSLILHTPRLSHQCHFNATNHPSTPFIFSLSPCAAIHPFNPINSDNSTHTNISQSLPPRILLK